MNTITYKFCDGATSVVEVSDEFFAMYEELQRQERCHDHTETRRHISLNYLNSFGIDFPSPDSDCLEIMIRSTDKANLYTAMSLLLPEQQDLIYRVFFNNESQVHIALQLGITKSSVHDRLIRALKRLKNLCDTPRTLDALVAIGRGRDINE